MTDRMHTMAVETMATHDTTAVEMTARHGHTPRSSPQGDEGR